MDGADPRPLHVVTWGEGPPVVFVHGLGASSRYWDELRRIDMGYTGIAVDLLGFGRSPKPPRESYDVACHLRHVLPHVPVGATIVGHSAGAILALALAAREPERVRGLVLCSLPAYPDVETARTQIAGLGLVARLTVRETWSAQALCWLMCRLRPVVAAAAPVFARQVPPAVARDAVEHTYASYSRTLRHVIVEHRVMADLATVTIPTVMLHGRDDDVVPVRFVEAVASASVALRVVTGDHYLPLTNPEDFAFVVHDMLDRASR